MLYISLFIAFCALTFVVMVIYGLWRIYTSLMPDEVEGRPEGMPTPKKIGATQTAHVSDQAQ